MTVCATSARHFFRAREHHCTWTSLASVSFANGVAKCSGYAANSASGRTKVHYEHEAWHSNDSNICCLGKQRTAATQRSGGAYNTPSCQHERERAISKRRYECATIVIGRTLPRWWSRWRYDDCTGGFRAAARASHGVAPACCRDRPIVIPLPDGFPGTEVSHNAAAGTARMEQTAQRSSLVAAHTSAHCVGADRISSDVFPEPAVGCRMSHGGFSGTDQWAYQRALLERQRINTFLGPAHAQLGPMSMPMASASSPMPMGQAHAQPGPMPMPMPMPVPVPMPMHMPMASASSPLQQAAGPSSSLRSPPPATTGSKSSKGPSPTVEILGRAGRAGYSTTHGTRVRSL